MIIEDTEIPYLKRVWKQIYLLILIFTIVFAGFVGGSFLITGSVSYKSLLILFLILLYYFLWSIFLNKYQLLYINTDLNNGYIKIKLLKFNTLIEKDIKIKDLDISIPIVFFARPVTYKIVIYINKKKTYQFYQNKVLSAEKLNDLYKEIKRLKKEVQ